MAIHTIKIDQIDLKILKELQKNACIKSTDLAKRVGLSTPSSLRRIKALKEQGYIKGSHTDINPQLLQLNLIIYCDITLENNTYNDLVQFQKMIHTFICVRECHMVTGKSDFLLKIIVSTVDDYTKFLTSALTPIKNIQKIHSKMLVQTSKNESGLPVDCLIHN